MKKGILLWLLLTVFAGSVLAQKGKEKKDVPADSTIKKEVVSDTTKNSNQAATEAAKVEAAKQAKKYDSLNAQFVLYQNFYAYVSNKFFPEKFKKIGIEKAVALSDSLAAANESTRTGLQSLSKGKMDSLRLVLKTVDTLRIQNQTFKAVVASLIGEAVYPLNEAELKGSWQVSVQPLTVTGTGHDSGIVSQEKLALPDSIYKSSIKQIVFLEEDLADIYFVGGRKTKCFYKVIGFSRSKTYFIQLQKGDEINMKLFVTPVPRGLQISYKRTKGTGQYMFGYMRK